MQNSGKRWNIYRTLNTAVNVAIILRNPHKLVQTFGAHGCKLRFGTKMSTVYTFTLQSRTKTVETVMNEWEFWPWKPLTTMNLTPSPPYQCCFATKVPLMIPQSFQTTLSDGRAEEKPFCNIVGVSIQGNWEIRTLIAFVSTSFVQDCSTQYCTYVHLGLSLLSQ